MLNKLELELNGRPIPFGKRLMYLLIHNTMYILELYPGTHRGMLNWQLS